MVSTSSAAVTASAGRTADGQPFCFRGQTLSMRSRSDRVSVGLWVSCTLSVSSA